MVDEDRELNGESQPTDLDTSKKWKDKELDKTPLHVPYVTSYARRKTKEGIVESDSATLKRYYSSIDAEVYFGNEYVEDISDINWQIAQQSIPIFGYNSYTADEIAVGARLITGNFSIKFTTPNYLFKILDAAKEQQVFRMDTEYKISAHDRIIGEPQGETDQWMNEKNSPIDSLIGTKRQELWPQTFDIDIVFGKPYKGRTKDVHLFLTQVRILTCTAMAATSNPVPITESYTFVARDIKTLT